MRERVVLLTGGSAKREVDFSLWRGEAIVGRSSCEGARSSERGVREREVGRLKEDIVGGGWAARDRRAEGEWNERRGD